ncbi:MAG: hypothetical protein COT92_03280 [Candidatus Doudnabacteria bacterium CG10_big_fil_rev_8_21_14_0_10_42_18]|uniref:Uncharacterized protein n=1 Tax=Candidatus Doudnabacteria bacterium CG10_big_fil_rev_8_21_14_0_10_42_18 TaxID=1974552 RepID=A0A2H0VAC7_9BACT|nr:MAG: hypothetical protein COT92_03280 [Candidatus Doudnabacteria bacterium CG10_big_fil_rev_8_21_14_0_10_42_18]
MPKKLKILIFLVISPLVLAYLYDRQFEYAGNWLEDYQNHFKFGFVLISAISSAWIGVIAKKEKDNLWLALSIIIFMILAYIFYLGLNVVNISF